MRFFLILLLTLLLIFLVAPVAVSQHQPDSPSISSPRVRVPEHVAEQNLLIRVDPVYPEFARRGHLEGTVTVGLIVDGSGHVQHAFAVGGPKELYAAAEEAVRQWRFHPYRLNGVEVPFDTRVRIRFTLPQLEL